MTDSVTIDLRRYEREQDAAEGRMKQIRIMVADLLEGEFDPYEGENLEFALSRICVGDVADALRRGNFTGAGEILDVLVRGFWHDRAWKQAVSDIDKDDGS